MRRHLSIADLGDLVERPLVAVLATRRDNGTVLLSPVWHEHRDGGFNVCTSSRDVKARHLGRDARAVLLLAESEPPYRGVELTTRALLRSDGAREVLHRVARRYLGERDGNAYAASGGDDLVIRLEGGQVRAWDFRDQPLLRGDDGLT